MSPIFKFAEIFFFSFLPKSLSLISVSKSSSAWSTASFFSLRSASLTSEYFGFLLFLSVGIGWPAALRSSMIWLVIRALAYSSSASAFFCAAVFFLKNVSSTTSSFPHPRVMVTKDIFVSSLRRKSSLSFASLFLLRFASISL